MFDRNIVEPPDHLYQEGNIIGKYYRKRKKNPSLMKKKNVLNAKEKKIHKYQKNDLGNIIDVEV